MKCNREYEEDELYDEEEDGYDDVNEYEAGYGVYI